MNYKRVIEEFGFSAEELSKRYLTEEEHPDFPVWLHGERTEPNGLPYWEWVAAQIDLMEEDLEESNPYG